jgi:hypothetical protein
VSATDVWAVGLGSDEHTFPVPPLVEHWDGTTWSIVPSPSAGPDYNIFVDVEAIGPNNVWAVGFYGGYGSPNSRALVEHWDGTSWSVVPHPAETVTSSFSAVAAVGPDDVWAIGFYDNGGPTHTLMEHWNGTDWSVVLAPELGVGSRSYMDMAAVSATDIWAVADSRIIHWDGSAWQVVSNPIENSGRLKSVAAVGPNDVWAVGDHTSSYQVVTEHWDGTGWSIVPNPAVGNYSFLDGVAAVNANDVWTVGAELGVAGGFDGTLTEHFTGNCP